MPSPWAKLHHFFLESDQSANTAGKNNTYPVAVYIIFCNSGIRHRLVADAQGDLGKPIELPGFFFIQETERIIIFQLAGKPGLEF